MPKYDIENTRGMTVLVTVNGQEINSVVEADTDSGYVMAHKLDARGVPMLKDDGFIYEKLKGEIVVTTTSRYVPRKPDQMAPVDWADI
jgi:hypothetical protein